MPTIQQVLTAPHTGANLALANAFLAFLATKLSADDYRAAEDLLWAAYGINREASQ